MKFHMFVDLIKQIESKKKFIFSTQYYNKYYLLNILYIF